MAMDLKQLQEYLLGLGDPLTLSNQDTQLPTPFQNFLKTIPSGAIRLSPGPNGIVLNPDNTLLTVTGTSSEQWPIQGMNNVKIDLSSVNLSITGDSITGVVNGTMAVSVNTSLNVKVTSLALDKNPWRVQLIQDATAANALELLLLGTVGRLPFDIPPDLDSQLGLGATVDSQGFAITFYPNTDYAMDYSLDLQIKSAQWTPLPGILSFNGIRLSAFIKPGSFSVVLSTTLTIGTIEMIVGVSMNGGENWTAFVVPASGTTFPGPVDLAQWALGQASGSELSDSFTDVGFDLNAFGLAISQITLGFNWKKPAVNFLKINSLLTIKVIALEVVLTLPEIHIYGSLYQDKSINVQTLLQSFGLGVIGVPDNLAITEAIFDAQLDHRIYKTSMQIDNLWQAGPVSLNSVKLVVAYDEVNSFTGEFDCQMGINNNGEVGLSAAYDNDKGWVFTGRTTQGSTLNIGDMIAELSNSFGITAIPSAISSLVLKNLWIQYTSKSGDFSFSCTGDFTISDTPVELVFTIAVVHSQAGQLDSVDTSVGSAGYSATFGGSVTFAALEFDIIFNMKSTSEKIFIADYIHTTGDSQVKLKDLIDSVSSTLAGPIPSDISINLKVVKFAFLQDTQNIKHFLFGVELGANIGLTDIPLIGDKLPKETSVAFENLQFAYATPAFTQENAKQVNALFPTGVTKIPDEGLQEGVLISSNLQLGDQNTTLSLTIPTGQSVETTDADHSRMALSTLTDTSTPPVGMSINVQKQFGPVGIQKIGLEYKQERLYVVGDITLSAQVLAIGLLGLGIGSKVSKFDPAVTLDGITITVAEGPLAISGGLYGSFDPLNFNGALMVEIPSMTIGALGGYAQIGDDPSFFMYLSVNRPLVGYPFFFLNGIAGGLGFNRDLLIPDIDDVANFPLVRWSVGESPPSADPAGDIATQVNNVIKALATDIPPHVGEYWIAAGLKFSSFEILNSFALLTVAIGTDFKIVLLGLTTASLPPNVDTGISPIGYAEMALKVTFSPSTGILEVAAKLTPASYILSKECNLTGGFAFYMWFKNNPDNNPDSYHAGDFVITLGGYNPAFAKPAYFPSEPLLGLNWTVDSHTTIKGGIYFAMTPSTLMAGGSLQAVWKSGDLKAWFTAHADFLLSWKPFHYQADIGLSIGASYKLDLWVTSKTISVHIGVDLALWGPSFGGKIYIDLTIISFTVKIGNQTKRSPVAIPWKNFKDSFLPAPNTQQPPNTPQAAQTATLVIDTDTYCLSSVAKGLIKDLSNSKPEVTGPDWVVNAEKLELVTTTAIPAKTASLITAGDQVTPLPGGANNFGVGPVNVAIDHFTSHHSITINRMVNGSPDKTYNVADYVTVTAITSSLPAGTWGGKLIINPSISSVNKTPQNISDLVVGYTIASKPLTPDHSPLPIELSILQQELEATVPFVWADPTIPTTDSFDQSQAMQEFMRTLTTASNTLDSIIQALNASDLNLDTHVEIQKLAQSADTVLLSAPVLSYLGEERVDA